MRARAAPLAVTVLPRREARLLCKSVRGWTGWRAVLDLATPEFALPYLLVAVPLGTLFAVAGVRAGVAVPATIVFALPFGLASYVTVGVLGATGETLTLLASRDDTVIGFRHLAVHPHLRLAVFAGVLVDRRHRRQGVATALTDEALRYLAATHPGVRLWVQMPVHPATRRLARAVRLRRADDALARWNTRSRSPAHVAARSLP